uniref:Titin n=1 Tax=Cyprinodon variegatus TaxID=28743 RepID=A0A3Q2DZI3_CYPVA
LPDTVTVRAGSKMLIEGIVAGKPAPFCKWKQSNEDVLTSDRLSVIKTQTTCTLIIKNVNRKDSGYYSLSAENSTGKVNQILRVIVQGQSKNFTALDTEVVTYLKLLHCDNNSSFMSCTVPPRLELGANMKNLIVVKAGENVFMDAEIHGKPLPKVSWKKDGAPLAIAEGMKASQKKHVHMLELFSVTRKESGDYTIVAENLSGSKHATIKLKVLGKLDVDASYSSNVVVMAGEPFRLEANVTGRPIPSLVWTKEGKELEDTAKIEIKTSDFHTTLINKDSLRRDGGAFTLTASNPGGFAKFTFNVKVLDRPGPPDSLTVTDIAAEKCVLNWLHPTHDGGAKIEYFIIQRRETSRLAWTNVATDLQANRFKVTKLLKGNEYIFRVMAVNKYGVGEPLETEPVNCVNPYGPSDPPTQPEVTTITKDSMVVCWERPEHDGGSRINTYVIERRDKTGLRWVKCNKRTVTDLRFKVSGLTPGHEYEFRVFAENNAGLSQPSPSSPFYKAVDTIFQPGPPGNPRVLDTSKSSITVAWNKPVYDGGSEITGYIVETCLPEEDEWTIHTPKKGWTATSFTITNLKENQDYKINICATNSEGVGEPAAVPGVPKAEDRLIPPEIELGADTFSALSCGLLCLRNSLTA